MLCRFIFVLARKSLCCYTEVIGR